MFITVRYYTNLCDQYQLSLSMIIRIISIIITVVHDYLRAILSLLKYLSVLHTSNVNMYREECHLKDLHSS